MNTQPTTSEDFLNEALTPSDCLSVTRAGELAIEGSTGVDLLARFGSPLFVLSERTLGQNVGRIRHAFEAEWSGAVNVMYAIKCNPKREPLQITADIVGPLCIPSVLRNDCVLPDVEAGDPIAILDAGMYAESDSHQLNWIPRPATVMVRGDDVGLVRAAETLDSIFDPQRIPSWLQGVNTPPSRYREKAIANDRE